MIVRMIFETTTAGYLNTPLTCYIWYRPIYNKQFTLIKLRNDIASHNMKWHIQCMHWVIKYCSHMFTCVGHNQPNVFKKVLSINIYSYNITRAYQSCILPYSTCVSFPSKYAYSNILPYPPHQYHVVHFSHYWANLRTVTYRPMIPICTI